MINKIVIFFSFFVGSLFAQSETQEIPWEDHEVLERFFDYLIHRTTLGYTLCGDKPVAIDTFPKLAQIPPQYAVKVLTEFHGYSILWRGLEVWLRYSHKFPSEKFVFTYVEDYNTIFLLNKENVKTVIEKNLALFQKYMGVGLTEADVLNYICDGSPKKCIIAPNQILLGILLGFGKNNSIAFANASHIQKLEGFKLYDYDDSLNEYLNPGFMVINNGTNDQEINEVKTILREGKRSIYKKFKNRQYFKTFIEIYCGSS